MTDLAAGDVLMFTTGDDAALAPVLIIHTDPEVTRIDTGHGIVATGTGRLIWAVASGKVGIIRPNTHPQVVVQWCQN